MEEIKWLDITHLLPQAAKELDSGAMLHAESFNLSDSMSALEMMDPKMDAGLLNTNVKPAAECLEEGTVDLNPDSETVVAILDRLLALEVTWIKGSAIAQTLFTCFYCQYPEVIEDETLRIYVEGMLKCCELVRKTVTKADIHEEEDFSTNLGGFSLCDDISEEEISAMMLAHEDALFLKLKANSPGGGDPWLEGLLARFRFRRAVFSTLTHLLKGAKGLKAAKKSITHALSQMPVIKASRNYDTSRISKHAIQPELNLKMMAPSPPRAVMILSIETAFKDLATILAHLEELCNRIPRITGLSEAQQFVSSFTTSQPSPQILARSVLRLLMTPEGRLHTNTMKGWVADSMKAYLIPEDKVEASELGPFIQSVSKCCQNYCINLCYNLGRQRRRLVHCVEEWAHLQNQAEQADQLVFLEYEHKRATLRSPTGAFFSGWLLDQLLLMVSRFMELGFQLRLYAPFEFSMIYWYLDYLLGVRINCQPALFFVKSPVYTEEYQKYVQLVKASKKKSGKGLAPPKKPEASIEQLILEGSQALCRGMFRLVAGLEREGVYTVDPLSNASLPLRFHRRFSIIMRLEQPQALTYEHYLDSTDAAQYKPIDLYVAASESFAQAKVLFERVLHRAQKGDEVSEGTKASQGFLKASSHNLELSKALEERAVTAGEDAGAPFTFPANLDGCGAEASAPKIRAEKAAQPAEQTLGGDQGSEPAVLPCDEPVVKYSAQLSFDFGTCPLYPCIQVCIV